MLTPIRQTNRDTDGQDGEGTGDESDGFCGMFRLVEMY